MQARELAVRLLLLFFPGVICAYIVDALTIHRPRTQFYFFIDSLVLGFACYFLYWAMLRLLAWCGGHPPEFVFLQALTDGKTPVAFRELAWATLTAGVLGLGVTFTSSRKLHFQLARGLGITKKFGELDVWGFVFNSPKVEWGNRTRLLPKSRVRRLGPTVLGRFPERRASAPRCAGLQERFWREAL